MATTPKFDKATFIASAGECLSNGRRLLDEAEWLEHMKPPGTSFALATIAQEEFAKGFLLLLVSRDVIPWNPLIYRATRDHTCKQLLGVVMRYMNPDTDEFLRRMEEWRKNHEEHSELLKQFDQAKNAAERGKIWKRIQELNASHDLLPRTVADAINILRHEKIGRWKSSNWDWTEEPVYDEIAKRLADGPLARPGEAGLPLRAVRQGRQSREDP